MDKDTKNIRKALLSQGWRIKDLKSGQFMAYPPSRSKTPVTIAGTASDHRAMSNAIARLRQSGFKWPP